ncbi:hypothetical protein, conserved [Babesia ovata]|uniref:Uncharacterized protein n=1 Tax=Babesia ovata TaxID=189622 RepID=A0A2H6KJD7_9APIC|nr:uncharacterized protein BOVATA_045910 [Babesia ovata]GBE63098.1 hypothetical protein, conserved [Babesia ovata]
MSFLHGVLSGVKDDDNVTKYSDINDINNVISTLHNNVGKGREAFGNAVTKVGERTNKVTAELGDYYKEVQGSDLFPLAYQLEAWMRTVESVDWDIRDISDNHSNILDSTLRIQLAHEIAPVKKVVEHLKGVAKNMTDGNKVKHVDDEIAAKENEVTQLITEKCQQLLKALTERFDLIEEKTRKFGTERAEQLGPLLQSVKQLVTDVGHAEKSAQALAQHYDRDILNGLQTISGKVSNLATGDISGGLGNVFSTVSVELERLKAKLDEIGRLSISVQQKVNSGLDQIMDDLDRAKESLKMDIRGQIGSYMRDELGNKIKGVVALLTKEIAGVEKNDGALYDVVTGVKKYAAKFITNDSKDEFGNIVESWVKDILGVKNGMLKEKVKAWIETSTLKSAYSVTGEKINPILSTKIANQVVAKLKGDSNNIIKSAGATVASHIGPDTGSSKNIEEYVTAVQLGCKDFAEKLEIKLKNYSSTTGGTGKGIVPLACDIAKQIENGLKGDLGMGSDSTSPKISDLELAVQSILSALVSTAKETAGELKRFTDSSDLSSSVHSAIKAVKGLGGHLERALTPDDSDPRKIGNIIKIELGDKATFVNFDTKLHPLLRNAAKKGISMLDTEVNSIINQQLRRVHATIGQQINRLNKVPGKHLGNVQQIVDGLQEQIAETQKLVAKTKAIAEGNIKQQVDSLRDRVSKLKLSIEGINDKIKAFDNSLQKAIQDATDAVETARRTLHTQIITTQSELTQTAEQAFTTVKKAVQSMFCEQHKADLTALHKLLETQAEAIRKLMNENKISGIKGLLNKLHVNFVPQAEKIDSDCKFKDGTQHLYHAINRFFPEFEKQSDLVSQSTKIDTIYKMLAKLVKQLFESEHFDSYVISKRQDFENALASFSTDTFKDAPKAVLSPLKRGLQDFVGELRNAYVNTYSREKPVDGWVEPKKDKVSPQLKDAANEEQVLTEEGKKCASACLTVFKTLFHDLHELRDSCAKHGLCNEKRIYLYEPVPKNRKPVENKLGAWLENRGFQVSKYDNGHEGHLKNKPDFKGENILALIESNSLISRPFSDEDAYQGNIVQLYNYFEKYLNVCHLKLHERKTYPCTVRDMCAWLSGLPHTAVYTNVEKHCETLLADDKNKSDNVLLYILKSTLRKTLNITCQISYDVLVTISGNGRGFDQADYPYATNFCDNTRGFHYPSDVPSLFDMLRDICTRLLYQLYFLYSRCRTPTKYHGWSDCSYGSGVAGSGFQCNTNQCTNQNCPQKADQNADQSATQKANQTCDQHPKCGVKSPLQSHLMDQLPGCLPHKVTSVGCSSKCLSCPKNSPGQQCITPMGFWDLTNAASITRRGRMLHAILKTLCNNAESPLCSLLRCLFTISPNPPKTLGDMFSFYCNAMQNVHGSKYGHDAEYRKTVDGAISRCFPFDTSLHNYYKANLLTDKLKALYCSDVDHKGAHNDKHCDLWSISRPQHDDSQVTCPDKNSCCAPYLQPFGLHSNHTYAPKNAAVHLSWFTYLAWDFWQLLNKLLDAFKSMSCKAYGCSCNCASDKHGVTEEETTKSACHCPTIVDCNGVLSVFHKYGFTFRVPGELMESTTKKSCDDFVKQLTKVLHKGYFKELFDEIDDFIWAIRTPFSYLLLALWSLSLLYLLHIAVVRLDVLRIRSHLRSPSSHRIAAQSLLAAARVRALANVKYFSP